MSQEHSPVILTEQLLCLCTAIFISYIFSHGLIITLLLAPFWVSSSETYSSLPVYFIYGAVMQ